ncbi:MAG: histidine phosphatase family protein [Candidatus Bathyarchaeota archaeon]|nr:histidine phosphatase family protein [Candidatus Bathyarchaeota archaeon]
MVGSTSQSCRLIVFRHAQTFDNCRDLFSGWRDSKLTPNGIFQAHELATQLNSFKIDYAFTSHLVRAKQTLQIALQNHPQTQVFVDDRLIERCYGLLQGQSKKRLEEQDPKWYARVHRGYDVVPEGGESLRMVEKRVLCFFEALKAWLSSKPGNVAICCHNNSIRPLRCVFEGLTLMQMLEIETPQNKAFVYDFPLPTVDAGGLGGKSKMGWAGLVVSGRVRLASDPRNVLRYCY